MSIWIAEIQWMLRNGFPVARKPILRTLKTIECRDAVLTPDGSEATWPSVDVIIGNPPFLGAKLMRRRLGKEATEGIRATFDGRLPGFTDLVCYWFEKARAHIADGRADRAGLVATNSIAKNTNLPVLRRIVESLSITEAYSDEPWVIDGAAVRVALVVFGRNQPNGEAKLDGTSVIRINANLTAGVDLSDVPRLRENRGQSMLGVQKSGPLDVKSDTARAWMRLPTNPNGKLNAAVLRP